MKNLKKLLATVTLTGIIILGTTNAQAGILINDFASKGNTNEPCTAKVENKVDNKDSKYDYGILINDFGILINDFGILINDFIKGGQQNCGILIND